MSDDHDPDRAVVRRRVGVTGRVQGVTYRGSTRAEADRLGVVGWVRNAADGSVEAELEGSGEAVAALVEWMHAGPRLARVDEVVVTDAEPTGAEGFEVR